MLHHDKSGWRINMSSYLYYESAKPSAYFEFEETSKFRKRRKLEKKPREIRSWLEMQDAYTLHKPLRRQFTRNPYNFNNILGLWECDVVDVQAFRKFNDNYRYLLRGIDVFSKFLHIVRLKSKIFYFRIFSI